MQSAETVLGVLRERGRRGLPCNELYRQLFNPQLYLLAYGRLYSNKGAMTPGVNGETVDGMSLGKIENVIDALRHERYRWSPARRVYIPKGRGSTKLRPLGLPPWSDKLVGEVIRLLLGAYYEPTFSNSSHGFRPRRGCHTALRDVVNTWTGTAWFVEGDIAQCFDRLDHSVMLRILGEKIHDSRFLRLVRNMLKAGYIEDWVWNATHSGSPQGGVVSPILSNIYLHKLDEYVERVLIPEYTRGRVRQSNQAFFKVWNAMRSSRKRGDRTELRELRKQLRSMPSMDTQDPGYRRLRYVRYADDTLLGFAGPKAEAEEIKQRLAQFLRDELKLELSPGKTLITHGRTQAARFLGYDITVHHNDRKITGGRRSVNGVIRLRVPRSVVSAKQAQYKERGKPARRPELLNQDDHVILSTYGSEYRGIVQYYLMAGDVFRLARLQWVMETSMLMTLANKHRSSVSKMARKYAATIETPHGQRKCFEARVERIGRKPLVGRFGGIPLRRDKKTVINDRRLAPVNTKRKELVTRLSPDGANHAGGSTRWKSTTSPSSQTSDDRATGRRGQISWPRGTAKPLCSAEPATRTSMARDLSQHSRSSHWRATCGDKSHASFGLGAVGKGPAEQAPRRRPTSTLWHNLAAAVEETVSAHAACWRAAAPEATPGSRNERVLQRHAAVHESLEAGVSLCETGRRLGLALNTVKRYARVGDPEQLIRPPQYRRCLVDPFRDHVRERRAAGPVATTTLLAEIRVLGYTGSPNLLVRYLEQGRAEESLVDPSVRRLTSWIMTDPDPDHLAVEPGAHRDKLTALCPEMTALTGHVTAFAKLLAHHEHHAGEHAALQEWIEAVSADDLPALHGFVRGLVKDRAAVQAGLDLPYSNGTTEGINNKTKLLKRQTYGRAGFALLRQRILLN